MLIALKSVMKNASSIFDDVVSFNITFRKRNWHAGLNDESRKKTLQMQF